MSISAAPPARRLAPPAHAFTRAGRFFGTHSTHRAAVSHPARAHRVAFRAQAVDERGRRGGAGHSVCVCVCFLRGAPGPLRICMPFLVEERVAQAVVWRAGMVRDGEKRGRNTRE